MNVLIKFWGLAYLHYYSPTSMTGIPRLLLNDENIERKKTKDKMVTTLLKCNDLFKINVMTFFFYIFRPGKMDGP